MLTRFSFEECGKGVTEYGAGLALITVLGAIVLAGSCGDLSRDSTCALDSASFEEPFLNGLTVNFRGNWLPK